MQKKQRQAVPKMPKGYRKTNKTTTGVWFLALTALPNEEFACATISVVNAKVRVSEVYIT